MTACTKQSITGSPPRGRGKAPSAAARPPTSGITPAWAGKSWPPPPLGLSLMDHPRVGGEKCPVFHRYLRGSGSPPRGRGKGATPSSGQKAHRITPAWAGKRHPRRIVCFAHEGSPPRGRGKVIGSKDRVYGVRITPAWAGKSRNPERDGCYGKDHPRVGGEKSLSHAVSCATLGSPPRGRGKERSIAEHINDLGITPAWAGKR